MPALTEDEARSRWCPFLQLAMSGVRVTSNRGAAAGPGEGEIVTTCIASQCMAWRLAETVTLGSDGQSVTVPVHGHGYCGLAGRP